MGQPTTANADTIYADILLAAGGSIPIDPEAEERALMLVSDATLERFPTTVMGARSACGTGRI